MALPWFIFAVCLRAGSLCPSDVVSLGVEGLCSQDIVCLGAEGPCANGAISGC